MAFTRTLELTLVLLLLHWISEIQLQKLDDEFCQYIPRDQCSNSVIKTQCSKLCSAPVRNAEFCQYIHVEQCSNHLIKNQCNKLCSPDAEFCQFLPVGQCSDHTIKNQCSELCGKAEDSPLCAHFDRNTDCAKQEIAKDCPMLCTAAEDSPLCAHFDHNTDCAKQEIAKDCAMLCTAATTERPQPSAPLQHFTRPSAPTNAPNPRPSNAAVICGGDLTTTIDPNNLPEIDTEGRILHKHILSPGFEEREYPDQDFECEWTIGVGKECQMGMLMFVINEGEIRGDPARCEDDHLAVSYRGGQENKFCGMLKAGKHKVAGTDTWTESTEVAMKLTFRASERPTSFPRNSGKPVGFNMTISWYCWIWSEEFLAQATTTTTTTAGL